MARPEAALSPIRARPPATVMRLERMGAFHPSRLSFLRILLRRIGREGWSFERRRLDLDARGVGTALYTLTRGARTYTLVAFSHDLPAAARTDRVIAEAWDATFALVDGVPSTARIEVLRQNVPRQEAGRYGPDVLVLARANRSVRLFDAVIAALSAGEQPDADALEATGYLMRTTAVYGNGKFGIADRDVFAGRSELAGPFQAEMLTVWLIRAFTVDLVEHLARQARPQRAVRLDPALRRRLGIGNATGLGMAPFLVRHPALIHAWISARETALARVRGIERTDEDRIARFHRALDGARALVAGWRSDDPVQAPRIAALAADLETLAFLAMDLSPIERRPWNNLWETVAPLSVETQELLVSLLLEPHGDLVDDLAASLAVDETRHFTIDGRGSPAALAEAIERDYAFALGMPFETERATARFWYVSEEKLEPRLGLRREEPGAELALPLAVACDVHALYHALRKATEPTLAAFLLAHPEHRLAVRRVQIAPSHPYAEVHDNLIDEGLRAVDLLRCKLAFFGCTRFDPRSDKWLRITLYQGAPFPDEITAGNADTWMYA